MSTSPVTVETVDRGPKAVSRRVTVDVPAEAIFARLSDPRRHHELDGSGTVGTGISGPDHLKQGDTFTVSMKMFGLPYRIKSTVTRLTENREIEWRHPGRPHLALGARAAGRRQDPRDRDLDFANSRATPIYRLIRLPKTNTAGIEATLRGLPDAIPKA